MVLGTKIYTLGFWLHLFGVPIIKLVIEIFSNNISKTSLRFISQKQKQRYEPNKLTGNLLAHFIMKRIRAIIQRDQSELLLGVGLS